MKIQEYNNVGFNKKLKGSNMGRKKGSEPKENNLIPKDRKN